MNNFRRFFARLMDRSQKSNKAVTRRSNRALRLEMLETRDLPAALAIPTALAAVGSNGQVALSWTGSAGATSYNIYRATTSGGEGSTPFQTGVSGTSFTDSSVNNFTTYYYEVSAVNAGGESGLSHQAAALPPGPGDLQLAIDAGGKAAGSFVADTDFSTPSKVFNATATINTSTLPNPAPQSVYQTERYGNFTYTIPGLTAGDTYNVALDFAETYWNSAGKRIFDVAINGTQVLTNFDVFAAAGGKNIALGESFAATADSNGQIAIQFTSVKDNAEVNGIRIYTADSNAPAIPASPTGVTAITGNAQVGLIWTASPDATSYNIYRSTTSGLSGATPIATGVTGASYLDTSATNGTAYYYEVTAVNDGGVESGVDSQVSATPQIPAIPTGLTATASPGQVALSWTASSGAVVYSIYRSTTPGGEGATPYQTEVSGTSFTDTNVNNFTTYYYEVSAVNIGGASGASIQAAALPPGPGDLLLAIDAGGKAAGSFVADTDFTTTSSKLGVAATINSSTVPNAAPQSVYQTERYGNFTYTIPGLSPGNTYNVVLDFAEIYWGSAGKRLFNVAINGTSVLTNFDVFAAAGGKNVAIDESFTATADSNGKIAIKFTSVKDNAEVNGIQIYTADSNAPAIPASPTGVTATASPGQVALGWTASPDATSYDVYRSTTSGVAGTLYQIGVVGTSFTDTSVVNGTTYYYEVTAVNDVGVQSGVPSQVAGKPPLVAPPVPVGVTATAGNSQVTLHWTPSSGAASYDIYRSTTSGGEGTKPFRTGVAGPSFTDTGLTNGTTYYYEVTAVNVAGQSAVSTEVSVKPHIPAPAIPAGVTATAGNAQVVLHWTASASATSYNVYRSTSPGGEGSTPYQTGVTGTSFTDTGVTNGFTYFYEVSAVNVGGESAVSTEVFATPQVPVPASPTGVTAAPGNNEIAVYWAASSGAASYNVYRSTTPGGEGGIPYQSGLTDTGFLDTNVTSGTTYYYEVSAVNAGGEGALSSEVSTALVNPGSLALAIHAGGNAVGSFVADEDYSLGSGKYSSTGAINTSGVHNPAPQSVYQTQRYGTSLTYTIPGLFPGAAYNVVLDFAETYWGSAGKRVFDVSFNGMPALTNFDVFATAGGKNIALNEQFAVAANGFGNIVIQFTAVQDNAMVSGIEVFTAGSDSATAPLGPTSVTATQGNGHVALNWTAAAGAVSYDIYRSTASSIPGTLYQSGVTGTSFTDTSVTDGTTYYYQVVAMFGDGESGVSNQVSATPLFPAIPANLMAVVGNTQVTLSWTASSDATSYNIYRSTTPGGEGATPYMTGVTNASFTDTNVTNGTTYYYEVVAVNAGGQSDLSSEVFATPLAG